MDTLDYLVFIGRFQPFHLAHMKTVELALEQSKYVIIALGSAQPERTTKNPFLVQEREQIILSNFNEEDCKRIIFVHIVDVYDDKKWVALVKEKVLEKTGVNQKIGLIGHFKDNSSYYLALFPDWKLVELDSLENALSATPIREAFYAGEIQEQYFPHGTIKFLKSFMKNPMYDTLRTQFFKDQVGKSN
ncbi:nicotinate-nicotinamide nucleotide adenylyltransferase [Acinetobacter sp. ESL0695]|uniref:Nicotinate-nicotinamide nucleotide adenylyltransferase n=1 Tax=Acinetobacter pollinis TaxID=2605270 RepID=A0ABU6DPV2_9GAMM|nr:MULTISPECIES: nicotinate-nicotinamide nucleotide adenylyltransferase [Acinetobacter]MEB5475869.1 nicotinate-nicotinamide nucleotide adenylyltransferase [Acinetobacter pollinis]WEV48209.1 nicotinate-nicotinamide nucleotide adenylyltransferase [Acinetobacter sp. ESL0695]